jgi:hypothetical protein
LKRISNILSDRKFQDWPSWFIVYEWENEISSLLNLRIQDSQNENSRLRKLENKWIKGKFSYYKNMLLDEIRQPSLYFEMTPRHYFSFSNSKSCIPVIIDFWDKSRVKIFNEIYSRCPFIFVSSLEVINFLKQEKFPKEIVHLPLSLPSKYRLSTDNIFNKKYDIVLAGRTNSVLFQFLKQYEIKNPQIEYLHQIHHEGKLFYKSNKSEELIDVHSREEYISLIQSAKVAFYATPGMDEGIDRTNGFNPVTPRLFELLSAGCHVIGRYKESVETDFFELNKILPATENYEMFEEQMNIALSNPQPIEKNMKYLENHYTSARIPIIKQYT